MGSVETIYRVDEIYIRCGLQDALIGRYRIKAALERVASNAPVQGSAAEI